jgi:hypothetical protein
MGPFLFPHFLFAKMNVEPQASAVFSKADSPRPAVYKLSIREFSKSDADAKLDFLKSCGFTSTERKDTGKVVVYKNSPTGQTFHYNSFDGEYLYHNPKVGGLTVSERSDTGRLRPVADKYLMGFLGDDGKNFFPVNKEARYRAFQHGPDTVPTLYQLAFRYVRVLDGRPIKGVSNHIIIRIGEGGRLAELIMTDKKMEKGYDINTKIKNSAMNKYLQNFIEGEKYKKDFEYEDNPIKYTVVEKACESYFAVAEGSGEYLRPHMSFWVVDTMADGHAPRHEFHLPVDGASVVTDSKDDLIEYKRPSKP